MKLDTGKDFILKRTQKNQDCPDQRQGDDWDDLRSYSFTLSTKGKGGHGASAEPRLEGEAGWDRKPGVGPELTAKAHLDTPEQSQDAQASFGLAPHLPLLPLLTSENRSGEAGEGGGVR